MSDAPSTTMFFWGRPSRDKEAMRVRFLPQFLGALPRALSPLGALAYSVVSEMFVSHSSTKRSLFGSSPLTFSRQALLAASSRSEAPHYIFVAPTELADRPAHRGDGNLRPMLALPSLAVALQGGSTVGLKLLP